MEDTPRQPSRQHLQIVGHLRSLDYHKADYVASLLVEAYPGIVSMSQSQGHMEFQWTQYKEQLIKLNKPLRQDLEGKMVLSTMEGAAIFSDGELKWNTPIFLDWASQYLPIQDAIQEVDFSDKAFQAYSDYISNDKYDYVYMEFSQEGKSFGQVSLELFKDLCPKTVNNFVCLCTGEKGVVEEGSVHVKLSYVMSLIHRVVSNGWIQGGDICGGNGDSGYSIYGDIFSDECFAVPHDSKGIIGMVNHGHNTNNSQFYITLAPAHWMDKKYVAFGRVIEGTEVLESLNKIKTFDNERPQEHCIISDCGKLTVKVV